jgi:UPF0042 nucleotide-binding protein
MRVVLVTGLSGAGRSTASKCLEDLGWFVVDNLPPALVSSVLDLARRAEGVDRVACVVDVRSRAFSSDLRSTVAELEKQGLAPRVLFLEASDEALVRRFEGVRRPHPLQGDGRLVDGIEEERERLGPARESADLVIDTSSMNVHELRAAIGAAFADEGDDVLHATVVSFGFKYGLPVDADLVADCRFLPNPHWVPELRPQNGRDPEVREYVLSQPDAAAFLDSYTHLLGLLSVGYRREGKHWLTVAVGCTGGTHRSVAIADALGRRLGEAGFDVRVVHRDMGRE